MEEKRLECLMMLQSHRSVTSSTDAVVDRFSTTAAQRVLDLTFIGHSNDSIQSSIFGHRQFLIVTTPMPHPVYRLETGSPRWN